MHMHKLSVKASQFIEVDAFSVKMTFFDLSYPFWPLTLSLFVFE